MSKTVKNTNKTALTALIALLCGCGVNNAVLDGEITLPPNPPGDPLFVVVEAVRTLPFDGEWEGSTLPVSQALESVTSTYNFSLVSENVMDDVRIKVRFCRDENCTALSGDRADPQAEIWVDLETPLYLGEFTAWKMTVGSVPACTDAPGETCTEAVDPVDVGGPEDCVPEPLTRELGYPIWRCGVARCDVECPRVVGATAGWCVDGQRGPHYCAQ